MPITQSEYSVTKQQKRDLYAKMYIMDFDFNVLDEISGVVLGCNFTNDSKSSLRRSCSISISPTDSSFDISYGNKLWLDKYIKIYVGIKDIHTGEVAYTNMGIYLINNPSRVYSSIDNTINIQGLDLMSKLTGERNGNLEGMTYIIPANTFSYSAIVGILEEGGFTQYALDYWNCPYTPNEIKIDIGGTLYDLLSAILEIDSMMQMYFDVDGVFHYDKIPITPNEQIIIDDDIWTSVLIDYQQDTNYDEVKNSIEVFGKTHDITNYDTSATMTGTTARTINVTLSGVTDYPEGLIFGVIFTSETIPQRQTTYLEINGASPLELNNNRVYDADDVYFEQNVIYIFRIASGIFDDILHPCIQYMGGLQPYAKKEENNSTSPFYIDGTMGTVRKVLNSGDYDNISTDLMATERASWELYQRCRVQDNIIIKCVPIYWADVNTVIEITLPNKNGIEETNRYMIKSISNSYGVNEVQTINAMKYFPYYNSYEPNMDGIYDTVNLFVQILENTTESIALSANFDSSNTTIDWGDFLEEPTYITSDLRYDRDYIYADLPDSLIYVEDGITYKGVWIKIKAPRTELNSLNLSYITQNITKFYTNVLELQSLNNVENLSEIMVIGDLYNSHLVGYNYLENVYMKLNNTTYIRFQDSINLKSAELYIPNLESATSLFENCTSLETLFSSLDTSNIIRMDYMFSGCSSLITIPLLNTSNVTNMNYMFMGCSSLTSVPLLNTSKVTDMWDIFLGCSSLVSIPKLDTSNVTDMTSMFFYCTNLKFIPLLNTSKVTNMTWMFHTCTSLTTITQLDLTSCIDIRDMFLNCISLENLSLININNIANISGMLSGLTSLKNISLTNINNVTNIVGLFTGLTNLENISLTNINSVANIDGLFTGLTNLKNVYLTGTVELINTASLFKDYINLETCTLLDTSSATNMNGMFYNCPALISVSNLDTSSVTDMSYMFRYNSSLTSIPQLDLISCTSCRAIFENCINIESIDIINTNGIIDFNDAFSGCNSLTSVPKLNLTSCKYFGATFNNCKSIESVDIINTSSVESFAYTFKSCESLTSIPQLDLTSCTNAYALFQNCHSIESVDIINTSSATSLNMFAWCYKLISVPQLDLLSCTTMEGMFYECTLIPTIDLINCGLVTDTSNALFGCYNLSSLNLSGLKYSIILPNTNQLTATALNTLFTSLGDVTLSPQTITITGSLGANTCDQTIATNKGWIVVN